MTYLSLITAAAGEITDLPATVNGNKAEQNESKIIRDKACTCLKELVDDMSEAGKCLFQRILSQPFLLFQYYFNRF